MPPEQGWAPPRQGEWSLRWGAGPRPQPTRAGRPPTWVPWPWPGSVHTHCVASQAFRVPGLTGSLHTVSEAQKYLTMGFAHMWTTPALALRQGPKERTWLIFRDLPAGPKGLPRPGQASPPGTLEDRSKGCWGPSKHRQDSEAQGQMPQSPLLPGRNRRRAFSRRC